MPNLRKFDKEDYEKLKPLEHKIVGAYKSRAVRDLSREEFDLLYSIFRETISNTKELHYNCEYCVLYLAGKMGKLYLIYKEEEDAISKEERTKEGRTTEGAQIQRSRNTVTEEK